jgi:hypothetical protein
MNLQELAYIIEANTAGLNSAFPALQKLEKSLDSLDKAVSGLSGKFNSQMQSISSSVNATAKSVTASTDKIQEALKRQQAALISSQQKLIALNGQIANSGAPVKLIAATTQAYQDLEKVLRSTTTTSADATLAKAKYNATLSESARALNEFKAAQSAATAEQKASEGALLKQANAVESVRLRVAALGNAMGGSAMSPNNVNDANKAFKDFEKTMGSGVLSAEGFQKAMHGINSALADTKRNDNFEKGILTSVQNIQAGAQRAAAALTAAQQKVNNANTSVAKSGGPADISNANLAAYKELETVLKSSTTTTAEATLARAKFNAALNDSAASLKVFNDAQAMAAATQKISEAALLRQSNAVAAAKIQYDNLSNALMKSQASADTVNALNAAFNDFEKVMSSGTLGAKDFSAGLNKWKSSLADIKRSSGVAEGIKGTFDEIGKSLQILLGPLSGVSSRFSALTGLAGGVGIAWAAATVSLLALGYAMFKSIQYGITFEKQMARINAVLDATGNNALESAADVDSIVKSVSNATNASQTEVRNAAAGLLTIVGMNKDVLESALKASQGLALIGGGSIETSFRNLSQALQDPAQGFQTLTQYGVKFNAMEKEAITTLVRQGEKTQAVALIMKKLQPIIAAAEGETDSLSGAWHRLMNVFETAGQSFSTNTGLLEALTAAVNFLAGELQKAAHDIDVFFQLLHDAKAMHDQVDQTNHLGKAVNALWSTYTTNPLTRIYDLFTKGTKSLRDNADAVEATTQKVNESSKQSRVLTADQVKHNNAVDEAGASYASLKGEYSTILTSQEKVNDELKDMTNHWGLMKESLMGAGKTSQQADTILKTLFNDIKYGAGTIDGFVKSIEKSISFAKLDAASAGATGAAKRQLGVEQELLNAMYDSGQIHVEDYGKSLSELQQIYPQLAAAIDAGTKSLEAWQMQAANNTALKGLQDQLDLAQQAASLAAAPQFDQSQGAAIAAKKQELLNRKVEEGSKQWNDEIALVTQLGETQFAGQLIAQQKELNDQIAMAQVAIDASTLSTIDEAKALAGAAKAQQLLNEGVKAGSVYFNQQVAAAQQLVDMDFTKQSNAELKSMQDQAKLQDVMLQTSFYSENTRQNMVDLAQKEIELAQKYGSLQDERAQKELAAFKLLQDRNTVVQHFADLGKALSDAFDTATDAITKWAQTGKLDAKELVRSIAADFFKLELKHLIMDPLHDKLGSMLGGLLGDSSGILPKVGQLGSTPINPMFVSVVSGGLGDPLKSLIPGSDGGSGGIGDILKSVGITPTPSTTGGLSAVGGISQDFIQKRIDDAFSGTGVVGSMGNSVQDAIQGRIDSAFSGTGVTGSASKLVQTNINDSITSAFNGSGSGGSSNPFLSLLGKTEGTTKGAGYNETLGYGKFTGGPVDLTSMNLNQVQALQKQMLSNPLNNLNSSAVGEYQITGKTLKGLMKSNNLDGSELFTPALQDKFASQLALARGPNATGLGQEWASLAGKNPGSILDQYNAGLPGMKQMANMPISATQPGALSSLASGPLAGNTDLSSMLGGANGELQKLSSTVSSTTGDLSHLDSSLGSLTDSVSKTGKDLADSVSKTTSDLAEKGDRVFSSVADKGDKVFSDVATNLTDKTDRLGSMFDNLGSNGLPQGFDLSRFGDQASSAFNPMSSAFGSGFDPTSVSTPLSGLTQPFMGSMAQAPMASNMGLGSMFGGGGGLFGGSMSSGFQAPLAADTGLSSMFGGAGGLSGMGGLGGGDPLAGLTDSVSSLSDSFGNLGDSLGSATSTLTDSFSQAATSAGGLATNGLDQATNSLGQFSDNALTNTIQQTAATTATTAQMGVTSTVTSAQIQQLGTSATTASAQIGTSGGGGGGIGGMLKSIGGLFGFASGGYTGGGGSHDVAGLVHNKEFVFDEQATRNIGVHTLQQMHWDAKRGRRGGGFGGGPTDSSGGMLNSAGNSTREQDIKIINLLDPSIVGQYLATRDGEKLLMNLIRKNRG